MKLNFDLLDIFKLYILFSWTSAWLKQTNKQTTLRPGMLSFKYKLDIVC